MGRPPDIPVDEVKALITRSQLIDELAKRYGVSRRSAQRVLVRILGPGTPGRPAKKTTAAVVFAEESGSRGGVAVNTNSADIRVLDTRSVQVHGDEVLAVLAEVAGEKRVYLPLKRLAENLGLARQPQQRKVLADETLSKGSTIMMLPSGTRLQETLCLRLEYVPLWTASINSRKVKPDLRDKIRAYKDDVVRVTAQVYVGQGFALNENLLQVNTAALEEALHQAKEAQGLAVPTPRNGSPMPPDLKPMEALAIGRLVERVYKKVCPPVQVAAAVKGVLALAHIPTPPLQIPEDDPSLTARDIAQQIGILTTTGNPHDRAVATVIRDYMALDDGERVQKVEYTPTQAEHLSRPIPVDYYRKSVMGKVALWIEENGHPAEIRQLSGKQQVFKVKYRDQSGEDAAKGKR